MNEEFEAEVINSHVVKCPICDGNQGIVLVWNDGDVDLIVWAASTRSGSASIEQVKLYSHAAEPSLPPYW